MASEGPPAENGTMMVMGREGKFWEDAGLKASVANKAAKTSLRMCFSSALFQILMVRSAKRVSNHRGHSRAFILRDARQSALLRMRT
jgi:hypothetical protein